MNRANGMTSIVFAAAMVAMRVWASDAMPLDANAELASAHRCDLIGPEVWTKTGAKLRWGEVNDPKPGLHGLLHVVHEIPGLFDSVELVVAEDGGESVAWTPVRNHWTPSFTTTYYRSKPNPLSPADEKRLGRIVLKETKAVLGDNTFLAEATLKNTSSLPLKCRASVNVKSALPKPGERGKVWEFATKSMGKETVRRTCVASATSFGGVTCDMEIPPHSENTFRYSLAFSPGGSDDALARAVRAVECEDSFVANARSFNEWFERNVPRFETSDPDLRRMYLYRWFVVKRGIHEARRTIADHEYPRRAVYESPHGGWYNCVIGLPVPLQIQDIAWMRDPGVLHDHVLNWCEKVRGYRSYIQYTGMAIAKSMENHPSASFARAVLPSVVEYARELAGGDPSRLPIQLGSWLTGAEYQPNFYQFTEPKWDFRNDTEFEFAREKKDKRFARTKLVRLDKAIYGIGNLLGAAKLAETLGEPAMAEELRRFAHSQLTIVRTRHWDEKTGFFLAADPVTYRLADEAVCYDSFAPYMWGLLCEDRYLGAFDKLVDRAWFWDDFPASTCAKTCPMYSGANAIYTSPASIAAPHCYGCSWNGPMWHYANSLFAEAFGQCAIRREDMRGKWLEFFNAWGESHFACGDRTVPVAGEHFRPEDGAYCGSACDYFHSSWIAPFFRYRCGIRLSDSGRAIVFDPFCAEDFRVANVPLAGKEYTFEQRICAGGRRLEVRDAAGKLLASGGRRIAVSVVPHSESR